MADIIVKDGRGSGQSAGVFEHRLQTFAASESDMEHASEVNSNAYSWSAVAADYTGGETILLVRNDSPTLLLHIDFVSFSTDNNSEFDIHLTDGSTFTPTGTAVTGVCLNRSKTKVAEATAIADETANTQGNIIWANRILAETLVTVDLGGAVILGNGQSIAVDVTTAPTSLANCNILGHYKTI